MGCTSHQANVSTPPAQLLKHLDSTTALLCGQAQALKAAGRLDLLTSEVAAWLPNHQEYDTAREKAEAAAETKVTAPTQ